MPAYSSTRPKLNGHLRPLLQEREVVLERLERGVGIEDEQVEADVQARARRTAAARGGCVCSAPSGAASRGPGRSRSRCPRTRGCSASRRCSASNTPGCTSVGRAFTTVAKRRTPARFEQRRPASSMRSMFLRAVGEEEVVVVEDEDLDASARGAAQAISSATSSRGADAVALSGQRLLVPGGDAAEGTVRVAAARAHQRRDAVTERLGRLAIAHRPGQAWPARARAQRR